MELSTYQQSSKRTQRKLDEDVFYYGLISESAGILSIFKKAIRDEEPESIWKKEICEEIGATLWYLSNICSLLGYSLEDCAKGRLNIMAPDIKFEAPLTFRGGGSEACR